MNFQVYKFVNNQYLPTVFHLKDSIYHGLMSSTYFGIESIRKKYIIPVLEWPLMVNVY